ncbi:zinc/manganese transport system substrate-binding protein [Panacagrimonas perspica]|uniref:Zinc/manganese transport system substrate-binding protein n=1 Tax=Panacagrimonas perspica TaxID=381431 RepID=A0A4R7P472_9GAMM|nr:zinc ABC transporter substrate-binding protein [Panacagrimonas perspica]TDU28564.1 zinc/manganese transport system substrate-binding protein [Panacagrimonas perspica]THD04899.1 zinc ABC transporter substrate-binding protein [Panacagrimonas perspica]
MKKLIATLLLGAAALTSVPASAALRVFACEPEWGALAKTLGGDDVGVYVATSALQDVHQIQPKPSLIAQWRQADLAVCTGAELEIGWLPALAEKGNNPKVAPGAPGYFEASRSVQMLEVPTRLDRSDGDVHPQGNPHIQTDPRNIAKVARALTDKLVEVDAAHADGYRARYDAFAKSWATAVQGWETRAAPLRGVAVVSAHKSWAYLYAWLGIREVAALESKPGIPPSGAHLQEVLDTLKTQPAKMVVYAAYQDRRPVEWMTGRAGIASAQLPFSPGGADGTDELTGLFDVTITRLLDALAGKSS